MQYLPRECTFSGRPGMLSVPSLADAEQPHLSLTLLGSNSERAVVVRKPTCTSLPTLAHMNDRDVVGGVVMLCERGALHCNDRMPADDIHRAAREGKTAYAQSESRQRLIDALPGQSHLVAQALEVDQGASVNEKDSVRCD
jgi:hypothetical protein